MGGNPTGAYLEVRVRRFRGNERFPEWTPELEYLIKKNELKGSALSGLYGSWSDWEYAGWDPVSTSHNIVTNTGRDYIHNTIYIATAVNTFKWAAVSAEGTAPATTDMVMAGEITTSDLARTSSITGNAHTANTNTTTIGITWTSASTYVGLVKACLNTVGSGTGCMSHEATFSSTGLSSGDQLALTWTITLG